MPRRSSALALSLLMPILSACLPSPTPAAPTASPSPTRVPVGYRGSPVKANAQWKPVVQTFDSVDMVLVPAGCFMMGSTDKQIADAVSSMNADLDWVKGLTEDEFPAGKICFDTPFWLDRTEVTNGQFARLGGVAHDHSQWSGDNRPRETISQKEAQDFCQKRGGRLPTEAEWEYAARGPDDLIFPWGNKFVAANTIYNQNSGSRSWDAGGRPAGVSWVGALDMSGNVGEWTSSADMPYPYDAGHETGVEDGLYTGAGGVVRGGGWFSDDFKVRAADRDALDIPELADAVGLRCARATTDPAADIAAAQTAPTSVPTPTPASQDNGEVIFSPDRLPSPYTGPLPEGAIAQMGIGGLQISALSPDGQYLALGTDSSVIVYRTANGEVVFAAQHSDSYHLAWSADSTRLAASAWRAITVYDIPGARSLFTTTSTEGSLPHPVFTPDGRYLVAADRHGVAYVWNASSGQLYSRMFYKEKPPREEYPDIADSRMALSPDGTKLALTVLYPETGSCCDPGHSATIWDIPSGTRRYLIDVKTDNSYPSGVFSFAWSPDSKTLAVSDSTGMAFSGVEFWDMTTGQKTSQVSCCGYGGNVSWSPDGKTVWAAGQLIDVPSLALLGAVDRDDYYDELVGWSADSRQVALHRGADNTVDFLDASTAKPVLPASSSGTAPNAFTNDFKHFYFLQNKPICCFEDRPFASLVTWDASTASVDRVFATGLGLYITGVALSPDASLAAFSVETEHRQVVIWDVAANHAVVSLDSGNGSDRMLWSPDGKTLANVHDNLIDFFDPSTWARTGTFSIGQEVNGAIRNISWSPDGRRIALTGYPTVLMVLEVPSGKAVFAAQTSDEYSVLRWSATEDKIATVGSAGHVEWWDARTGDLLNTVSLNLSGKPTELSFSPDLALVAVLSGAHRSPDDYCNRVQVFDTSTGALLHTLASASADCGRYTFWQPWLPDGSGLVLYVGSTGGIYDPRTGRLLKALKPVPDAISDNGKVYATSSFYAAMLWEMPQ